VPDGDGVIIDNGKVGVGIEPETMFHAEGAWVNNYGQFSAETTTNSLAGLGVREAGSYKGGFFYRGADDVMVIQTNFAEAIRFEIGGNNEKMRIHSDGNVGIGVTNPSAYNSVGNTLVVGNTSGNAGITIASSTSGYGALYFADGTSGQAEYDGAVEYNHSTRELHIWAGGTSTKNLILKSNGDVTLGADITASNALFDSLNVLENSGHAFITAEASDDEYIGGFRAVNDSDDDTSLFSHGTDRPTTRYGTNVSGFGEIFAQNMTNGLMIGVGTAHRPIIFGSNDREVLRIQGGPPDGPEIISGSAVSTGSFGNVYVDQTLEIGNGTQAVNISILGNNSNANSSKLSFGDNKTSGVYPGYNGVSFRFDSDANKLILEDEFNNNQAGTRTLFEVPRDGNFAISGSSTSTGSFGKLLGDGSDLTGVSSDVVDDTSPQLGGNLDLNSNDITGTGNIDITGNITAQNFIVSSSVTSITYQSLSGSTTFGDTGDDTHQFTGSLDITGSIEMNSLNPSVTLASMPHGGTPVIRFIEGTDFRGGFVKFDGATNVLKIGTHNASDSDASNDIDAITMARGTGIVTIPTSLVSDGNVTAAGYIAGTGTFGSQKANILNNFNSYIGLVLKRTGSGTADFLRLTDSSENTKFSVEDDGTTNVAGNFLPTADNNSDLGAADKRWANIYSADLQLSNEGTEGNEVDGTTGNWTIQEGKDDLYLLNRKNGKKYKFKLEEVT